MANLPLLPPSPIVDPATGAPNAQLQQFWQQFANGITANIDAAAAAQSDASGALAVANAAQATADSKLDQATADGLYVSQGAPATWGTPTGVFDRTTFVAYIAPTISNPPTQAEVQGVANALQSHSQHLAALISDLRGNNTLT